MRNLLTKLLYVVRKYFVRLLAFSIVFAVAFCTFSYIRSDSTSSVILSFTYPNASYGLYPNGTLFNVYNIFTEDVIEKAINDAGLTGYVDPDTFADEITIRPRNDASLITTQYIIKYTAGRNDQLGAVSAEGLLHSLIYSYIDHFHNTYSNDQIVLDLDTLDEASPEYVDLLDYYNMALNQLVKYLSTQQANDKDFLSNDGTSFQDLINIIEQYRTTSLSEIRSIVTERGITRDEASYLERLNFRIMNLTNTYEFSHKEQQSYKDFLRNYKARLTSIVFIPSLDLDRGFYMSKTKSGMDTFTLSAMNFEEDAEEIRRQIKQTEQYISKIKSIYNSSAAEANTARVDALIAELRNQLNATMNRIQLVEKEYSRYKNHSYVTLMPLNSSFLERTRAKRAVMYMLIIDAILVLLLMARQEKKGKETR